MDDKSCQKKRFLGDAEVGPCVHGRTIDEKGDALARAVAVVANEQSLDLPAVPPEALAAHAKAVNGDAGKAMWDKDLPPLVPVQLREKHLSHNPPVHAGEFVMLRRWFRRRRKAVVMSIASHYDRARGEFVWVPRLALADKARAIVLPGRWDRLYRWTRI